MADLIAVCFISLYAYIGLKKGFVKSIINLSSTLISLLLTSFIYHPVSEFLYKAGAGDKAKEFAIKLLESKAESVILERTAEAASVVIVNVISFIAVIFIIKIILMFLSGTINFITKFPLIKQVNSLFGMVIGFVSGVIITYIVVGIIAALGENEIVSVIKNHIENSYFVILMYEDNMIANLLMKILL